MHNGAEHDNTVSSAKIGGTGLWWLWLTVLVVVLDQASKFWLIKSLAYGDHIPLLPMFNISHVHNYGAAWGMFSEAGGGQRWALAAIAVLISGLLLWWMKKTPKSDKVLGLSFSLILGGAIGNLYDRFAYGYVEDFIDVFYNTLHFPSFNIADSAITIGAMFLIYDAITAKSEDEVSSD